MSSPQTPSNKDAGEEATPPPSSFLKRVGGWILGSAIKKQRLATPPSVSTDRTVATKAPAAATRDCENGGGAAGSSSSASFAQPIFSSPPGTSTSTPTSGDRSLSSLPSRKPMVNFGSQKIKTTTASAPTVAFNIGAKGTTAPAFKRIQFGKDIKFSSSNANATAASNLTTPARNIQSRKSTPFSRRQGVRFRSGTTTTPAGRRTFARTPYKASTPSAMIAHAGVTPYRQGSSTPYRSAYKPTSAILTSSASSKLSTLSKTKSRLIAKEILSKQTKANLSPKPTDDALFHDPTKVQKASVNRIYGRNQDGSRVQGSLGNGGSRDADAIRDRRESAKKGAFVGEHATGTDYWSNVNQHVVSEVASPSVSATSNGHSSASIMATKTPVSAEESTEPSMKRKKVSFQNITPPGGRSSKDVATGMDATVTQTRMPVKFTPFKIHKEPKCITLSLDGEDERREGGVITYPMEKIYGQNLDYKKILGESSKGAPDNEDNQNAIANTRDIPMIKFYRKKDTIGSSEDAKTGPSSLPFDFMPKTPSSSRKGSSSLLNKPIPKRDGGDMAASTPAKSAAVAASNLAPTPAAQVPVGSGWGNLFAKKPGEWKCDVCYVMNKKEDNACISCESPRGSTGQSKAESSSSVKTDQSSKPATVGPNFNFAEASATTASEPKAASGGFTFAAPSSSSGKKDDSSKSTGFTFGAPSSSSEDSKHSTGGFTFGSPSLSSKDETKPATGGFTFGAPASKDKKDESSKASDSGFTFGAAASGPEKKDEAKPVSGKFSFGAQTPTSDKKNGATKPASGEFTFGSATAAPEAKHETKPSIGGFQFGAAASSSADKKDEEKPATSKFTLGSSASKNDAKPNPSSGGFNFGATSQGSVSTEKEGNTAQKQNFSFGSASTSKPPGSTTSTPSLQFGSKATDAPAPSVAFGSIPSKTSDDASEFKRKKRSIDDGSTASKLTPNLTFGGSSTTVPAPAEPALNPSTSTPAFTFGSKKVSQPAAAGNAHLFSFGSSSNTTIGNAASSSASTSPTPGSSASLTFGSSSTPAPAPVQTSGFPAATPAASGGTTFAFGQQASTTPAAPATGGPPFAFGAATTPAASAPAAGGHSFFGASAVAPVAPPPVAFGSAAQPVAPTSGFGSGFGQLAPPPQQSSSFAFGSQAAVAPATPAQFGASNSTPGGFGGGFGQSAQAPAIGAPTAGGGFSIGKSDGGKTRNRTGRRIIRAKRPQPR